MRKTSATCMLAWKKSKPTIILLYSSLFTHVSHSSSFIRFAHDLTPVREVERDAQDKHRGKYGANDALFLVHCDEIYSCIAVQLYLQQNQTLLKDLAFHYHVPEIYTAEDSHTFRFSKCSLNQSMGDYALE